MMVYMPGAPVELSPSGYWDSTEERRAQRIYVSFCELAAAVLDYAEGLSLLRRDERRQGAARLNWAGTIFYYSLVHSARFLVFAAVGDFPTSHNLLPNAFRPSEPPGVSTNWLKSFAAPNPHGKYTSKVSLSRLFDYWSAGVRDQQIQEVQTQLGWFADALTKAKALRNESNYEALLIAHEYRHEYLDDSFKNLANAMAAVSKRAATIAVTSYARMLRPGDSAGSRPWRDDGVGGPAEYAVDTAEGHARRLEAAFISRYVQKRIVEPAMNWYGTDQFVVATAVKALVEPLTDLSRGQEFDPTIVDEPVSMSLFGPKFDLMVKFREKIKDVQGLVDDASEDSAHQSEGFE